MPSNGPSDVSSTVTRRTLLRGAGGAMALALAGCVGGDGGDGESGGESGDGGRLTFAQAKSFVDFDPVVANDVPSVEIIDRLFDSPYGYGVDLDLVPVLASEMPEIERNGARWIVPLNTDATFHNGDAVTAEDVAYSYTAPLEEETENAGEVNMITEASAVDEETVQFDLEFEFGAFRHYLTRNVVPQDVREEDKEAFNKESPVGCGPFQFVEATQGESATIERWDDYWGDPVPNLQTVQYNPIDEGTTRVTTLETGENDVVKTIPPQSWETVENMDDAGIEDVAGVSYFYLAFNCNEGPTTDPQVREAVDYAVSMDQAVERFVEPSGVRANSPIPATLAEQWEFPLEEWAEIGHEQDVDQAKEMLDGAEAVPGDWNPTIIVPPDDKRENIGVSVANGLEEAGYGAEVQRLDWPEFLDRYNTGSADDYNMYTLGWAGSPDPDTFMYFLFAQEQFEVTNGSFYENDEVDQQIMNARESTDTEERKQLYEQAIRTILEDRAHLPAYTLKNSFGVNDRVQNWLAHPTDQFQLASADTNVAVQ